MFNWASKSTISVEKGVFLSKIREKGVSFKLGYEHGIRFGPEWEPERSVYLELTKSAARRVVLIQTDIYTRWSSRRYTLGCHASIVLNNGRSWVGISIYAHWKTNRIVGGGKVSDSRQKWTFGREHRTYTVTALWADVQTLQLCDVPFATSLAWICTVGPLKYP